MSQAPSRPARRRGEALQALLATAADTEEDEDIIEASESEWEGEDVSSEDEEEEDEDEGKTLSSDEGDREVDNTKSDFGSPQLAHVSPPLDTGNVEELIVDSEIDSSELEDLMFGLGDEDAASKRRRKKRRRRRKTIPYSRSLKDKPKTRKRTAAVPATTLSSEAQQIMQKANDAYLGEEYDKALAILKEVIKICPGVHDPFHLMGLIYETVHCDYKKAINSYLIAASIIKTDDELWQRVGQLARRMGCQDLAIYCYRRVVPTGRNPKETNEVVAYDLATLFLERQDYARAALYFDKLLTLHPGDNFISMEMAKCYYQLTHFTRAINILEACVSHMMSASTRTRLNLYTFAETAAAIDGRVTADDTLPRETLNWSCVELLAGILLEQNEYTRCKNILLGVLFDAYPKATVQEVLMSPTMVTDGVVVRLATAHIRAKDPNAAYISDLAMARLDTHPSSDIATRRYLGALADSFLEAEKPTKALEIYKRVESARTELQNSEFWVKAAKCYMQVKDYEQAASFLESVLPGRPGSRSTQSESLAERVRQVEAKLLLFEVLSHLDESTGGTIDLGTSDLLGTRDAANVMAQDNRIQGLVVGSSVITVPDPISSSDRHLMLLRLSVYLGLLYSAERQLTCQTIVAQWLEDNQVDALALPKPGYRTMTTLLPPVMEVLLTATFARGGDRENGLTKSDIWRAVEDSVVRVGEDGVCGVCGRDTCAERVRMFLQVWRYCWIAEFVLLVKDSSLDMRRVLLESSRSRAHILTRELAKERGFLNERTRDFATLSQQEQTESGDEAAEALLEEKFVLRTRPKTIDTELRRRQQRYSTRGPQRLLHHAKLRENLGLTNLEDALGWDAYYYFMEAGSRVMHREGLGRLAVELLESALLGMRYSRAMKTVEYATSRLNFKANIKRLSLRLASATNLMRVALSTVRITHLLPLLRVMSQCRPDVDPACNKAFGRGLFIYATMLFTEGFAHHAAKSISASRERDILSFNRAWCTRHLMEFPHHFGLTMMVAHYCLLSMRWPYAVAEYTRAVHLHPSNVVAALCLATSTLSFSTSRGVQDRHQVVLRGYAALKRFTRLRRDQLKQLVADLRAYAVSKTHRVMQSGIQAEGNKFVEWLGIRLRSEGVLKGTRSGIPAVSKALGECIANYVEMLCQSIIVYAEAEESYNFARAFHHLSLEYLAVSGYEKVLDTVPRMIERLKAKAPLLIYQAEMLVTARHISPPIVSTLAYLASSALPPAVNGIVGLDKAIQWPSLEKLPERFREPGAVSLAEEVLLCKVNNPSLTVIDCPEIVEFLNEGLTAQSPMHEWLYPRCHNPNHDSGLIFSSLRSVDSQSERRVAAACVRAYKNDLLPGYNLLTVDAQQLVLSSALNLSNISRAHDNHIHASHIQRTHIVWT